eukprot:53226_1
MKLLITIILCTLCSAYRTFPPANLHIGGFSIALWNNTGAIAAINKSIPANGTFTTYNNFSFVPLETPHPFCNNIGDMTIRIRPTTASNGWTYLTSASANVGDIAPIIHSNDPKVIKAYNVTTFLTRTPDINGQKHDPFYNNISPLQVIRSYEISADAIGFIIRFNITNTIQNDIEIGSLGFAMPCAGPQPDIEQAVWNDPHIGLDHGWVEWTRIVVDEQVMLAFPIMQKGSTKTHFEAWRPIMENTCGNSVWEYNVHSLAWAYDWNTSTQWPYLYMSAALNQTNMWPNPKTPWPAWHLHDTVPITNKTNWNKPTSDIIKSHETKSYAIKFQLAEKGPRTRDQTLLNNNKVTFHAVPGYVLSSEMKTARLFINTSNNVKISNVTSNNLNVLTATLFTNNTINLSPKNGGRASIIIAFSDASVTSAHYAVINTSFKHIKDTLGLFWEHTAWLPRNFIDPFGRSASMMPYDRENKQYVFDDSRAYDVGLSDDAGGASPLGYAMKVGHGLPIQTQVNLLDEFINCTLYGYKYDTAKPPYKSLQIRYDDIYNKNDADGIRMTIYYYNNASNASNSTSGHFSYNYTEANKCNLYGKEDGPSWCMSESSANATYRVFNYPHHTASYYNMYRIARYHSNIKTYYDWSWYLQRAANTTIKFGIPSTGVMDGTVFREVLRSLKEEAIDDPNTWNYYINIIEKNMLHRAQIFYSEPYPYGSEFAFDTTGQEEVVVWLMYFANGTYQSNDTYMLAAKKTVDHVLSYMKSSGTWAYHGGSRSWGDLGNNGKWMVSSGTACNFETRGNMHYRSGLNMIPLIEWYRSNPDDFFLLEISMGAQAGQLVNIEPGSGAPSMMLHMLPHILDYDPHSGDFGLGFFGHTLETGAYYVNHPSYGNLCYQCEIIADSNSIITFEIMDSYHIRVFIEPLAMYIRLDTGTIHSISMNVNAKTVTVNMDIDSAPT